MDTLEEAILQKDMHATSYHTTECCKTCTGERNSQHAHCGKAYIIDRGSLKEITNKNFYDPKTPKLNALTRHIYSEFHLYFYKQEPVISGMLAESTNHAANGHAVLQNLNRLFTNLKHAITTHFLVEETVLFPHIVNMTDAQKRSVHLALSGLNTINASIGAMENEHDNIGSMLQEIKQATNQYTAPPNEASLALLYSKLRDLHQKIRQHIYLENNILYPRVLLLQKELIKRCLI